MSKHKHDCCCCMNNSSGPLGGLLGNDSDGLIEAVIFWLIACGAGLLNNRSILIILLFLLYGFGDDNFGLFGM